jgi:hypothetical protein
MAKNEVTVSIDVENLNELIEKANQLKKLLGEVQDLIDSLSTTKLSPKAYKSEK